MREEDWRFRYRYMGPGKAGHVLGPARHIRNARPDVVVSLYESAPYILGLAAARSVKARTVIHVMKVFDTWRPRRRSREAAKRLLFPRVDGIHSPGRDAVTYAMSYGARESQFHVFPEPIDVEHFVEGSRRSAATKAERDRLGLSGCVLIVVGRVIRHKGLDYLFDAYERLCRDGCDVSLLIVGDGADEGRYRERAARLPRVVFGGFVQQASLPQWYALADAMVFPTLGDPYGYVVEEAMACSLPVVTSSAAGEIQDRVDHGVTGYIVPPADADALYTALSKVVTDQELRMRLGKAGLQKVRGRTNDWWAGKFEEMVFRTVGLNGSQTPGGNLPARRLGE